MPKIPEKIFYRCQRKDLRLAATYRKIRKCRGQTKILSSVVVEIGAGTAIPTVRWFGEMRGTPLIRINPGEPEVCTGQAVSLALGAHVGLQAIARELRAAGFLD